jgi:DNA-binding Lrp family transcriptional regulator
MEKKKQELILYLSQNSRISLEDLSASLELSVTDTAQLLDVCEKEQLIIGYTTIVNNKKLFPNRIQAIIELSVRPEQKLGYSAFANLIRAHKQVKELHLVSGGYDFLVVVEAESLQEISILISDLASIENVNQTATHVVLDTYKKMGVSIGQDVQTERLAIIP